jgi:hypothetical protein
VPNPEEWHRFAKGQKSLMNSAAKPFERASMGLKTRSKDIDHKDFAPVPSEATGVRSLG